MASTKQTQAAKRTVKKTQKAATATAKKTIAQLPKQARTAIAKQGAAVPQRKRAGGSAAKTKAELYQIAKKKDLPGRSKMGRDELAHALGVR